MSKRPAANSRIVYSSDHGRMCPGCNQPAQRCTCTRRQPPRGSSDGIVRIGRSTKGRKGKGVTIITGIPLPDDQLSLLARELKQLCGSGGTVKDGTIEIQGEHRDRLVAELQSRGYTVKRSGG